MRRREMILWVLGQFAAVAVSRTLYVYDLLVIRIAIPVAAAAMIRAYDINQLSVLGWSMLELGILLANFLGRLAISATLTATIALYILGELVIANAVFLALIWYWSKYPTKDYLGINKTTNDSVIGQSAHPSMALCLFKRKESQSNSSPIIPRSKLLDNPWVMMFFLVITVILCGIVGIIGELAIEDFTMDNFQDFWATEAIGNIIMLPALLFLSQIDWSWKALCSLNKIVLAAFLSAIVIVIPIVVDFVFETPLYSNYDPIYKIFWTVLLTIPVLSVSGSLLGVAGLTSHIVLAAIVIPLIRFLPGEYDYADNSLNIILLIVDIAMLPYLVLLSDMSRLLNSVELQVQERTAELEKTIQEKTHLMSFLCHELRNPLHCIASMTELELEKGVHSEYAETITTVSKFMIQLCSDVLDTTKMKCGKTDLKPEWCDLSAKLKDQCDAYHTYAAKLGVKLKFHTNKVPKQVFTDPLRWTQCFTNLVTNACRFTSGGGHVDVYLISVEDPSLPQDHCKIRFEITDTGVGIDAAHIPTLFIPFSIASQKTTREYQGSGLGLSLCAMLVELMGGKIQVDSEVGVGTKFWFELVLPKKNPLDEIVVIDNRLSVAPMTEIQTQADGIRELDPSYGASGVRQYLNEYDAANLKSTNEELVADRIEMLTKAHYPPSHLRQSRANNGGDGRRISSTNAMGEIVSQRKTIKLSCEDPTSPALFREEVSDGDIVNSKPFIAPAAVISASSGLNSRNFSIVSVATTAVDDESATDQKNHLLINNPSFQVNGNGLQDVRPKSTEDGNNILAALLVDDSDVNKNLLASMLLRFIPNLHIDKASDGLQAIEACNQRQYQIIFMDLVMPSMGGWEATRFIRQQGLNQNTPIIITSGNTIELSQEREGVRMDLMGTLTKPFLLKELRSSLEKFSLLSAQKT